MEAQKGTKTVQEVGDDEVAKTGSEGREQVEDNYIGSSSDDGEDDHYYDNDHIDYDFNHVEGHQQGHSFDDNEIEGDGMQYMNFGDDHNFLPQNNESHSQDYRLGQDIIGGHPSSSKSLEYDEDVEESNGAGNSEEFESHPIPTANNIVEIAHSEIPKGTVQKVRNQYQEEEEDSKSSEDEQPVFALPKYNEILETNRKHYCEKIHKPNENLQLKDEKKMNFLLVPPWNSGTELNLAGNVLLPYLGRRLNDSDLLQVGNVLVEMRTIKEINLAYNVITDKGIVNFAPVLQDCENIDRLNLMHNNFTSFGVLELFKALMLRSPLSFLRLTGVNIGKQGIDGLICLIMCGRSPLDLDIGECDLNTEGFQGICSAWQAVDLDIDYPDYLLLRDLPIDLGSLKKAKEKFSNSIGKSMSVDDRRSRTTFPSDDAIVVKADKSDERVLPNRDLELKAQAQEATERQNRYADDFSAAILEGFIEIRNRFDDNYSINSASKDVEEYDVSKEIILACKEMPDVYEVIEEYQKIKNNTDAEDRMEIVSPSLYSLTIQDDPEMNEKMQSSLNDDENQDDGVVNELTVVSAAAKATVAIILESAQIAAGSEVMQKTDVIQLMLMTIVDTAEQLIRARASENIYSPELSAQIMEKGVVETLTEEDETRRKRKVRMNRLSPKILSEEKIGTIAVSFLEGTITEAGRIIGSGDPYGIREQAKKLSDESMTSLFDRSDKEYQKMTQTVEPLLQELLDTSALLAGKTIKKAECLKEIEDDFHNAAQEFIHGMFNHMKEGIGPINEADRKEEGYNTVEEVVDGPTIYPNISRPTRLVLNRPLFQGHASLMAAKLADYLEKNTSVKCLHIRKWNLGEDGTVALMDGLMYNTTIVLLDLSGNQIGPEGMRALAPYLVKNVNLRHLLLNHNRLRNPGMMQLASVISQCRLVSLNVSYNDATDVGLDCLLSFVHLTVIKALYVLGNYFAPSTWNLMNELIIHDVIDPNYTDIVLQKVDNDYMVVQNSQCRDTNEWYEAPAIVKKGLHAMAYFSETAHKSPQRIPDK